MAAYSKRGRDGEIAELIGIKRAISVIMLMQGQSADYPEPIDVDDFIACSRSDIRRELSSARQMRGRILEFCTRNFVGLRLADLARLHEEVAGRSSMLRISLGRFERDYAPVRERALLGAPVHSMLCLSPFGLQVDFPEKRLMGDVVEMYAVARECDEAENEFRREMHSFGHVKAENNRARGAGIVRRKEAAMRMAVIACFNLVEAYCNGLAWECCERRGGQLSEKELTFLSGDKGVGIIEKITKVPKIFAKADRGPLERNRDPLKTFAEVVKPFRDASVHASPFATPERFGGYNKLDKVYGLDMSVMESALCSSLDVISAIHRFLGRDGDRPPWVPGRDGAGGLFVAAPGLASL